VGESGGQKGEDIPPLDRYRLRTPADARIGTTVQDLERDVTNAAKKGIPWVILVFHGICSNMCTSQESTKPSRFSGLLDWLAQERSAGKISVRTIGDVLANGTRESTADPRTTITCQPSAACSHPASRSKHVRVSLHVTGATGAAATYYTTDGTDPKTSATWQRYQHPFVVSGTTMVRFYSRDAAGHSEAAQTQRIEAAVPGVAGSNSGQTLGVTSSRQLIAGSSFVLFLVMLFGGVGLVWRSRRRERHRQLT
jgi:hypothetical protein